MKILFLDIDGVLNNNRIHFEWINRDCMARLNRIVRMTRCKVVISSAWRYMIINGDMTLIGFTHMLSTHGFAHPDAVIGHTASDEEIGGRAAQIMEYVLSLRPNNPDIKFLAVDDLDLELMSLHKTDGDLGLTDDDMEEIIRVLGTEEHIIQP